MSKHDGPEPAPTSEQQSQCPSADWAGIRSPIPPATGASDAEILGFTLDGKPLARGALQIPGNVRLGNEWPPERNELLAQLWNTKKYSASQIAHELGVTRSAVIGRARRMGLDHRTTGKAPAPFPRIKHDRPRKRRKRLMSLEPVIDPIVPPAREVPTGKPVPFFDLRPQHCRWPLWDDAHPALLFCGALKNGWSSYCDRHARKAFVRTKPR
jgi:GcrA cell cycle regulator